MGKHKQSTIMGFLDILRVAETMRCPRHEKKEFPYYGKIMGKHKYSFGKGFLHISRETEIHTTPKTWEKYSKGSV